MAGGLAAMKPVDQTRFHISEPLEGPPGNCYAACLASLFEVNLSDFPDEAETWKPGMGHRQSWRLYLPRIHAWIRERGYVLMEVQKPHLFYEGERFDPFCIISGPSPRNAEIQHAVVGCGLEIVHDPHPSRAGLLTIDDKPWWYEFLVPINAAMSE